MLLGGDCTCHEGYGMTETTGATCVTYPDDLSLGHVGGPFPCCEVKLVDVPEMSYLHSDRIHDNFIACEGRGEIWVRGPGVISGYYKDEEETEAAGLNSPGGWLKSGDIGMSFVLSCFYLIIKKIILIVSYDYFFPQTSF